MKKVIVIIVAIAVTFAGLVYTSGVFRLNPIGENIHVEDGDASSVKSATYYVDGTPIKLTGNFKYFGNAADGDINGDGVDDVAFLFTDQSEGSGTFYYVAAAIRSATGYTGTNALYIGDRIAPQNTTISEVVIEVNYADRDPREPMSAKPSVGKTMYVKMVDGKLVASEER